MIFHLHIFKNQTVLIYELSLADDDEPDSPDYERRDMDSEPLIKDIVLDLTRSTSFRV